MTLTKIKSTGIDTLTTGVSLADSTKIKLGAGNDLQIYHNGTNQDRIDSSSTYLILEANNHIFRKPGGSEDYAKFFGDGAVELYHNNVKKFETDAGGVNIAGGLDVGNITSTGNIDVNSDGGQLQFGADNDMQIYHNGANGEINCTSTNFTIDAGGDIHLDADGGDVILKDGGTEYGRLSNVLGGLTLKSGPSANNAVVFSTDGDAIFGGDISAADGTFSGTIVGATATASSGTNTTALASTAFVRQEITALIDGAPGTLDTLNELAAAINDDSNYNSTLTTALATKLPLAGGTMTGNLTIDPSAAGAAVLGLERGGAANQWKIAQGHTSTDYLEILEGSNSRLTIKNGGDVLVGTTSNSYNRGKFTVFGDPGNPATTGTNADKVAIRVATTTGNSQSFDIGMYNTGDYGAWLQASNSGSLQNFSPIVLNPNGGNVGIGTSTPNAFLSIRRDNNNSGNQFIVADTEGVTPAVRTYTHSGDDSGLILNHYYALAGSNNQYMRYADFVANVGNGAGTTMRFITKNAANTFTVGLTLDNIGDLIIGSTSKIYSSGDTDSYLQFNQANTLRAVIGDSTRMIINTGETVFNEDSGDFDFRVESNNSTHQLFVDSTNSKVLVSSNNTASVTDSASALAARAFEVNGNASEGSDNLSIFAMSDGTGNYGIEVSNSAHTAQYDLLLAPIKGGNVGIGTTVTDEKLHVENGNIKIEAGAVSTNRGLILAHTGQTGNQTILEQYADGNPRGRLHTTQRRLVIEAGSGGGTGTGEKLELWTNASRALTVDTSQKVGIGTSSPNYLLHVDALGSTDPSYIVAGSGSDFVMAMGSQNSPGVAQEAFIGTLSDQRFKIKVNNTVKGSWTSGGLAIGTHTSASAPLDLITNSNVYAAEFTQSNTSNGDGVFISVGSAEAADYALTVRSNGGSTSVLAAKANGQVGIGTFVPDRRLHVKGGTTNVVGKFESTDSIAAIEFADPGGSAEIGNNGNDLVFFPAGADGGRFHATTGQLLVATDQTAANCKVHVAGGIRFNAFSPGHGLNTVSYQSFNNSNTANACGSVYYAMFAINIYHNNGHSQCFFVSNGGGGVGYNFTGIVPGNTNLVTGTGINTSFTTIGSQPNTFQIQISSGGGALTVSRSNGTGSFGVSVHKWAGG